MDNKLKTLRQQKKLTLTELASQLNATVELSVTPTTLARYEKGEREPKLATWQKLADFFDVAVSYIQGMSDLKGNRIKKLRLEKNITLEELSKILISKYKIYLYPTDLSAYEKGEKTPRIHEWQKLAHFFDVSTSYLQGLSDIDINSNSFSRLLSMPEHLDYEALISLDRGAGISVPDRDDKNEEMSVLDTLEPTQLQNLDIAMQEYYEAQLKLYKVINHSEDQENIKRAKAGVWYLSATIDDQRMLTNDFTDLTEFDDYVENINNN